MNVATITGCSLELEIGDVIRFDGRLAKVIGGGRTQVRIRYLNWFERQWFAMRGLVRLRGFWSRVWTR